MRPARTMLGACAVLLVAAPAGAWGPAVHMREADAVLEHLHAAGAPWSDDAPIADAAAWLHLGSIAPDFERALDSLPFGHDRALSYHLLDVAPADRPDLRLFALGHLTHNLSDGVESFFCNWAWAQTAIGHVNLLADTREDAAGEAELICETVGDVILGDWHDVVDVIFDFYADSDEAERRGREAIQWYCEEGAAFYARDVDCDAVVTELYDLIAGAADQLALGERASAYTLVDSLLSGTPAELLDLLSSGLLDTFAGARGGSTMHRAWDRRRLVASPVLSDAYWNQYTERGFDELAPSWVAATLTSRDNGWPRHNLWGYRTANLESMFRFSPDDFVASPGLIVDSVSWSRDGADIVGIATADAAEVVLSVRMYAALPFDDEVVLRVRGDLPGLETADDPVVASTAVRITADPHEYVADTRELVSLAFEADDSQFVGYYAELAVAGSAPWHRTNTDDLWQIEELPLNRRHVREIFDSYSAFPRSLRISDSSAATATVIVAGHFVHTEAPIAGVDAQIDGFAHPRTTGTNGLAIFDGVAAGAHTVVVRHRWGEAEGSDIAIDVEGGQIAWVDVDIDSAVQFEVPERATDDCIEVGYTLEPIPTVEATRVIGWIELEDGTRLGRTSLRNTGRAPLCGIDALPDQSTFFVVGHAEFDAIDGLWGRSAPVLVDRSVSAPADDVGADDVGPDVMPDSGDADDADATLDGGDTETGADAQPDAPDDAGTDDADANDDAGHSESGGCTSAPASASLVWLVALVALPRRRVREG